MYLKWRRHYCQHEAVNFNHLLTANGSWAGRDVFIVSHLLWHRTSLSLFFFSFWWRSHLVTLYGKLEILKCLSYKSYSKTSIKDRINQPNLKSLHQKKLFAKSDWNWPNVSREKFKILTIYMNYFAVIFCFRRAWPLMWKKNALTEFP